MTLPSALFLSESDVEAKDERRGGAEKGSGARQGDALFQRTRERKEAADKAQEMSAISAASSGTQFIKRAQQCHPKKWC